MLPSAGVRLAGQAKTVVVAGIGVGVVLFAVMIRRWFLRERHSNAKIAKGLSDAGLQEIPYDTIHRHEKLEAVDSGQDVLRSIERAFAIIEAYRTKSEKHSDRFEELSSIADRLRLLGSDVARLLADGVLEEFKDDFGNVIPQSAGWATVYSSPRAGTLSVLSDDSFMSAYEEFSVTLDEDLFRDFVPVPEDQLIFYKDGLRAANNGEVQIFLFCVDYRKMRGDICQCESELDFAAKLWCIRQAFATCLHDEHRRMWLAKTGRTLLGDILKHSKQDPSQFYIAFDALLEFFRNAANVNQMEEELADRGMINSGTKLRFRLHGLRTE
ncbi:unnamed protein product [Haemonchus placei]|uniref:Transmembrane protein n=1 Tax=Haemonchus placei TaxID=6290 RepID=A0A0N4W7G6_HAEPC|nr:unnamed protein product [Haemonchus placei]